MQAQTQGPASSPTLWKGTVHHGAEPCAPLRHQDRAQGVTSWGIHVGMCVLSQVPINHRVLGLIFLFIHLLLLLGPGMLLLISSLL